MRPSSTFGRHTRRILSRLIRAKCVQIETFVILGRAALCREGKRIHFVKIECFLHRMDALPSRFAEHDNSVSMCPQPAPALDSLVRPAPEFSAA